MSDCKDGCDWSCEDAQTIDSVRFYAEFKCRDCNAVKIVNQDASGNEYYTEEDIGKITETVIENVLVVDEIVKRCLPMTGQPIIGPRLKLAHLFARCTMIPAMEEASEATERFIRDAGDLQ